MQEIVKNNLVRIKKTIANACEKSNRDEKDIKIVAVTKYTNIDGINECLNAGIHDIGESKVQDAIPKIEQIIKTHNDLINWHFIGHLQSNKVKYILPYLTLIHSLDRLSLANELDKQAQRLQTKVSCLIQVNVAKEDTKHGIYSEDLFDFANKVSLLENINICGLMTMAPYVENPEEVRPVFAKLKKINDDLKSLNLPNFNLQHLSMGMSNDYQIAIEEGATIIRIGSALLDETF